MEPFAKCTTVLCIRTHSEELEVDRGFAEAKQRAKPMRSGKGKVLAHLGVAGANAQKFTV